MAQKKARFVRVNRGMGQLSAEAQKVLNALQGLPQNEQATKVTQGVIYLAAQVADAAPAAAPSKRAEVQAALNQGVAEKRIMKAGSNIETVDRDKVVEGQISAWGKQLDTLLFSGWRAPPPWAQKIYVGQLSYRYATRKENLAYAKSLMKRRLTVHVARPESKAFGAYTRRYVQDVYGGVEVVARSVRTIGSWLDPAHDMSLITGSLIVHTSAESK